MDFPKDSSRTSSRKLDIYFILIDGENEVKDTLRGEFFSASAFERKSIHVDSQRGCRAGQPSPPPVYG
jgi:hypothetical protein